MSCPTRTSWLPSDGAPGARSASLPETDVAWVRVQVPLQEHSLSHLRNALKALDDLEGDLVKQQHEAAQPKSHHFELAPQS